MFKDFVLRKQELFFRNSCFIFAAVTIFVYRYDRMTVSIRIGCPLYRYCIDTDCIVPALLTSLHKINANLPHWAEFEILRNGAFTQAKDLSA